MNKKSSRCVDAIRNKIKLSYTCGGCSVAEVIAKKKNIYIYISKRMEEEEKRY